METVDEPVAWDGHLVLVHASERQRRAGVTAWMQRGLQLGAKIFYIEPADEPADRSVLSVLRDHRIQAREAMERGQLRVLPAEYRVYEPSWQARAVVVAVADGYPTVRWAGEASTGWGVISPSVHAEIERAADELCQTRPVSMLCQYPSDLIQSNLEAVCALHGDGVRDTQMHISPVTGGIALAGAADASNERLLRSALRVAAATTLAQTGSVEVDLRDLSFLDAAGARALLTGTTTHRIRGGMVRLTRAQRPVERVLRLLAVDRTDGFTLGSGRDN